MHIGKIINRTSNKIKRSLTNLDSISKLDEISESNGRILGFIAKSNEDVFQKDIEREFSITRSTASNVISLMEKKGLIRRESVDYDKRLKKLVLTDYAKELGMGVLPDLIKFEERLVDGFTQEEIDNLISYLERINNNLERNDI